MSNRIILFHKPYDVLCQFSKTTDRPTLADFDFPKNVYAAGRLDADSEGLLLLTNDGALAHLLTDPKFGHERSYCVQVEGIPGAEDLRKLEKGIILSGRKTKPASARFLDPPPAFPERKKPIRYRMNIPTSWLEVTLTEGRNRQVRRMTAAIGHPTLRLIRVRIANLTLGTLTAGEWRDLRREEIANLKKLTARAASR